MSATRRTVGSALGFALVSAAAMGPRVARADETADVAQAVEALRLAMMAPDRAKLEALVADGVSYGHSAGKVENKAQFVDSLVNRTSILHGITLTEQAITLSGDAAVVRHRFTGESEANGQRSPVRIGVLMVWQKQAGRWRLLARQAVGLPA